MPPRLHILQCVQGVQCLVRVCVWIVLFRGLFTCSFILIHMYRLMNSVNRLVNFKTVKSNYQPNWRATSLMLLSKDMKSHHPSSSFSFNSRFPFNFFFFSFFPFLPHLHFLVFQHFVEHLDGFYFCFHRSACSHFHFTFKMEYVLTSIVNMIRSFLSKQIECEIVFFCTFHLSIFPWGQRVEAKEQKMQQ